MWRDAVLEALGPNGRLMTDLVPELRLIIGEQPPVPELEPLQAQVASSWCSADSSASSPDQSTL
jgi:predicted ATPase